MFIIIFKKEYANSLAILDLKVALIQVSASVSATNKILFLVAFVVTFCSVMKRALFKINLLHICRKIKKSEKLANCHFPRRTTEKETKKIMTSFLTWMAYVYV